MNWRDSIDRWISKTVLIRDQRWDRPQHLLIVDAQTDQSGYECTPDGRPITVWFEARYARGTR